MAVRDRQEQEIKTGYQAWSLMKNKNISSENLLNFNIENDIISIDEALNLIAMKKRIQQAKAMHPYEIHHTEASGYFTSVDDVTRPTGKRKIRKCSEEKLWEALADWYLDKSNTDITLEQLYEKWIN